MADSTIWHLFVGRDTSKTALPLERLSQAGCHSQPWRSSGQNGDYGIVFFEDATSELAGLLQETSHGGLRRVLAISLENRSLGIKDVQSLLQSGASDYLCWPQSKDPIAEITPRLERWREVDDLVQSPMVRENLVGGSQGWLRVLRDIIELARFTNAPALITGESGTGKELAARLIHSLSSDRCERELVVVDCTTIVPELSGSEFFGHERGAYTGATGPRTGAFELAHGGTLFLDEVGELPLPLQAQLLRAIQERTYKRVGGNEWRTADFRLVCATNRPLIDDVKNGRFRSDLYYRIAAGTFKLPSLRERAADILPLARHFLRALRPEFEAADFTESAKEWLLAREYPGNVRDLKLTITRISYRHVGPGLVTLGDVPPDERECGVDSGHWADERFEESIRRALAAGTDLKEISRKSTEIAIRIAIEEANGSLQRAALRLGVTDRALQMRRARGPGRENGADPWAVGNTG
jgi:transcriptional regulator with GAF, ATPase, and Fis domain